MQGMMMHTPLSIIAVLKFAAEVHPSAGLVSVRTEGDIHRTSYPETFGRTAQLAHALAALGINNGDRVATLAWNGYRHFELYFGIAGIGAVCHTINPRLSAEQLIYITHHAADRLLFLDLTFVPIIEALADKLPQDMRYVVMTDRTHMPNTTLDLLCYEDLLAPHPTQYDWPKLPEETACILCYTSGTTGKPKGVMLSHNNIISQITTLENMLPIGFNDRAISFLPLCHVFERVVEYFYMFKGTSIYYAQSIETIGDDLKEIQPTIMPTVPRLLEKVYDKIIAKGSDLTGLKKVLFFWAVELGLKHEYNNKNGIFYELQLSIANKIIFNKWREAVGGKIRYIVSGASALQARIARIFTAAKMPILEGYGLSETSPVISVNLASIIFSKI